MKTLINEAKKNISLIAKETKKTPKGYNTSVYFNDSGKLVIVHLYKGWQIRTDTIHFDRNLTKEGVKKHIEAIELEHEKN